MADKEDHGSDSASDGNPKTEETVETTPTNEEIPQILEPTPSDTNNVETPPPSDKEIKSNVYL